MKKKLLVILISILLLTGCGGVDPDKGTVKPNNCKYDLIEIEPGGIIYIEGFYTLAPYYSPNGKLCHLVDGKITELE